MDSVGCFSNKTCFWESGEMFCGGVVNIVLAFTLRSTKASAEQQSIAGLENVNARRLISKSKLLEWRICVAMSAQMDVIIIWFGAKNLATQEQAYCGVRVGISEYRKSRVGYKREPAFRYTLETNERSDR